MIYIYIYLQFSDNLTELVEQDIPPEILTH